MPELNVSLMKYHADNISISDGNTKQIISFWQTAFDREDVEVAVDSKLIFMGKKLLKSQTEH